jgi:DNA processing protein
MEPELPSDIAIERKSIIMAITEEGGVGPRMFQQLLMRVGPPEDLLKSSPSDLDDIPRLGEKEIDRLLRSLENIDVFTEKLYDYKANDINVTSFLDDDYPQMLRAIGDPPPLLYYMGRWDALSFRYVALVGTTRATQAGLRLAVDLAKELVRRGFGIISGLAAGIDSAAHLAALKEQGSCIAVLGCGLLDIYPAENKSLAELIARSGLLISEYQPFRKVSKRGLVLRNRLISALSSAVVVVQVGEETKGELKTAAYALKHTKPLFYCDPEGDLEFKSIKDSPGTIIKDVNSVDEIMEYVV